MFNLDIFKEKKALLAENANLKAQLTDKPTDSPQGELQQTPLDKAKAIVEEAKAHKTTATLASMGLSEKHIPTVDAAASLNTRSEIKATLTTQETENQQRQAILPAPEEYLKTSTTANPTDPIQDLATTVQRQVKAGHCSYGAEDKIPKPSYYESGLILPCYYMAAHDYYLAWHREAGLRVISGRYAAKQTKPLDNIISGKPYRALPHTAGLQSNESIPLHLAPRKEWVVSQIKVSANVSVTEGKWEVVEVTESEFKDILAKKPDYKSLLRAFGEFDGQLPAYEKYAYKVVLDLKQITRVW